MIPKRSSSHAATKRVWQRPAPGSHGIHRGLHMPQLSARSGHSHGHGALVSQLQKTGECSWA